MENVLYMSELYIYIQLYLDNEQLMSYLLVIHIDIKYFCECYLINLSNERGLSKVCKRNCPSPPFIKDPPPFGHPTP